MGRMVDNTGSATRVKDPPGLPDNTRSMFGQQVVSRAPRRVLALHTNRASPCVWPRSPPSAPQNARKKSGPAFGFGAASRDVAGKVFISQEHASLAPGNDSPGPNTANPASCPAAVGAQPCKQSAPRWGFGKAERFPKSHPDDVPGPGKYDSTSAYGHQVSSRNRSGPRFGFGCSSTYMPPHTHTRRLERPHRHKRLGLAPSRSRAAPLAARGSLPPAHAPASPTPAHPPSHLSRRPHTHARTHAHPAPPPPTSLLSLRRQRGTS